MENEQLAEKKMRERQSEREKGRERPCTDYSGAGICLLAASLGLAQDLILMC